ncbi:MAG: ImmA/IrrE family metallo-endopeptidase [Candidatus Paceibacterota bacterium]|jgi:HTH-type transcriptional regulator/antitoxin HigA
MIKIKTIKTEKDYEEALKLAEMLIGQDPNPDSEEGERLSILSSLIESYEAGLFPETLPGPIDAIKFRMEQSGLKPVDLIPYIGSRSRVSEILSGKRQLTLEMIRALEIGLGIPAKVLIKNPDQGGDSQYHNWDSRLVSEMENRDYFEGASLKDTSKIELLQKFFLGYPTQVFGMARKSNYRSSPLTDKHALAAWATFVVKKSKEIKTIKYKAGVVDVGFMQEIVKLSVKENGPILAQEYLKDHGIILVIEPHFPKTRLDGAAILLNNDNPVIGLTLRHDRLDNFWFTLMHELAHIVLHYDQEINLFYDELDDIKGFDINIKEQEADSLASEVLVPSNKWEISAARLLPSSIAANSLAKELGVHVAIIAGKIRYEGGKWSYLNSIIGQSKVKQYFSKNK